MKCEWCNAKHQRILYVDKTQEHGPRRFCLACLFYFYEIKPKSNFVWPVTGEQNLQIHDV